MWDKPTKKHEQLKKAATLEKWTRPASGSTAIPTSEAKRPVGQRLIKDVLAGGGKRDRDSEEPAPVDVLGKEPREAALPSTRKRREPPQNGEAQIAQESMRVAVTNPSRRSHRL